MVAFGLWFWSVDRGGPVRRLETTRPRPTSSSRRWRTRSSPRPGGTHESDYLYVSFTNSIAFSPTDAMPLTRWVKLLMLAESGISAVTILLVAARAMNILG